MAGLQRTAHFLQNQWLTSVIIRHLKQSGLSCRKPLLPWTDITCLCLCTDSNSLTESNHVDSVTNDAPRKMRRWEMVRDQKMAAVLINKDLTGKVGNKYQDQEEEKIFKSSRNKDKFGKTKRWNKDGRENHKRNNNQDKNSRLHTEVSGDDGDVFSAKVKDTSITQKYNSPVSDSWYHADNKQGLDLKLFDTKGKSREIYDKSSSLSSAEDFIPQSRYSIKDKDKDLERMFRRRKFYKQDIETAKMQKNQAHYDSIDNWNSRKHLNSRKENNKGSWHRDKSDSEGDDVFGTLTENMKEQPFMDEDEYFKINDSDEDERPHIRLSAVNRRNPPEWYENKIKALGREGKVKECIEVFEEWMLKKDRVLPTPSVVSTYLGVLGRAGYTKKAFDIFNQMKKMKGLKLEEPTYTALFNACANSPWREDGLKRATHLRHLMLRQNIEPNLITTKAMVKAFGTLGDVHTAFLIADEAGSKRMNMDPEFFSFLLMAAISDKESGFKYGIEVWKKMLQWRVQCDIYHYNLLIRVIQECGIGNPEEFHLVLTPLENPKRKKKCAQVTEEIKTLPKPVLQITEEEPTSFDQTAGEETDIIPRADNQTAMSPVQAKMPDILSPAETYSDVVSIRELKTAQDRFALIGGLKGFLSRMDRDNVKPNKVTFTQLLKVTECTTEDEERLIEVMTAYNVSPDVLFFNELLHKRCMRHDNMAARAVIPLMTRLKIVPDMRTYACLALTCKRRDHGMQLINEIQHAGMMPNSVVLGSLVYASLLDFSYKREILECMEELGVSPTEKTLLYIQRHLQSVEKILHLKNEQYRRSVDNFKSFYERWLHSVMVEETDHPWKSFQTANTNREPDRDRFKTKLEAEQRISRRRSTDVQAGIKNTTSNKGSHRKQ